MPSYDNYARLHDGRITVRYSVYDEWGMRGWPPALAREFAAHILALADQAEREDARVKELAGVLNENWDCSSTPEDLALALHRAGYRKKMPASS